jgi:NAD(P)-dependent dehydrogenase (short-subunit alcohol dehydrogenase family)
MVAHAGGTVRASRAGTLVVAVYAGYIDTDMTSALPLPKTSPDVIAARVLAGIESGSEEILADERARKRPSRAVQGRRGV